MEGFPYGLYIYRVSMPDQRISLAAQGPKCPAMQNVTWGLSLANFCIPPAWLLSASEPVSCLGGTSLQKVPPRFGSVGYDPIHLMILNQVPQ